MDTLIMLYYTVLYCWRGEGWGMAERVGGKVADSVFGGGQQVNGELKQTHTHTHACTHPHTHALSMKIILFTFLLKTVSH